MAITLSDYPAIDSPAACPKCGSMDLSYPWCGRRTGLHLSRCKDCGEPIRSREPFTILERKIVRRAVKPVANADGFQQLRSVAASQLDKLNARDGRLRQSREPGEDDVPEGQPWT